MELRRQNGTLSLGGLRELTAANARMVRQALSEALAPDLHHIEIDLSEARLVDGAGLGTLLSILEAANQRRPASPLELRLRDPAPPAQQMLELTRLDRVFHIVTTTVQPQHDRHSPAPSGRALDDSMRTGQSMHSLDQSAVTHL